VLLCTSRGSQTPLELSKVLSDSARAFSGAPGSTCRYGGAFRMLQDLTYRIVKCWSSWDLCTDFRETSRAADPAAQLCGGLGAVDGNEIMSIYCRLSQRYTPRHTVHLCYPCISIHPPSLLKDILGGGDQVSLKRHLQSIKMQSWRQ
jgi:hypothetical protein